MVNMLRTFVLMLMIGITMSANAQENSLTYNNTPLQEIIKALEVRYDVVFSYTADLLENITVSFNLSDDDNLEQVLNKITGSTDLLYDFHDGKYIVLKPRALSNMTLCATIFDGQKEPLSFVNIYIPSRQLGTSSDIRGELSWTVALKGNESVEFTYIGYEKYIARVSDLMNCPDILLKEKEFSFEEVIVKEYVTTGIDQSEELDHIVLRPDKINMVPGLTDADVLQMVQLLPGVQSIDESATGLFVRGGTPDQNLILYDGIPVYNGGHFFGMISAFNPALVQNVKVHRSGFGPNYGGRVSSVIDIRSIDHIPQKLQLDAGINFTHGDISMIAPVIENKLGFVLGFRKSYTEIVETPTYRRLSERVFRRGKLGEFDEEVDPENLDFGLVFDFNDFNAKLIFQPSEKDKISFSFFHIDDNLNFDFRDVEDDFSSNDQLVQNSEGWGMRWNRSWSERFESKINLSYTRQTNNYQFSLIENENNNSAIEDLQFNMINDITAMWDNNLRLGANFDLNFGGQYAILDVERSWQFDAEEDESKEIDENDVLTGFISLNSLVGNRFKSKMGLRINHARATGQNYFEPRFSLNYIASENLQFKTMAGFYRQFMSQVIEFNDLGINQDFWVLSDDDENIPVVLSKNFTLGMIFNKGSLMFEVDSYYKKRDGLTSNLSTFRSNIEEDFEQGTGTSWGIDFLLKKRWGKFLSWMTYSYSRTNYTVNNDFENFTFRAPHDRPHSFSFVNQINSDKWNFSVQWSIASGIVYTEALGLIEEEEDDFNPEYDLEEINNSRLPISHRLDFSVMYKLFSKGAYQGKFGLSLLNVYNNENIMSREYYAVFDEEEDEHELQIRDRAMLRFTPNLVFRISFN